MTDARTRLRSMVLPHVSLCGVGRNEDAVIMLSKAREIPLSAPETAVAIDKATMSPKALQGHLDGQHGVAAGGDNPFGAMAAMTAAHDKAHKDGTYAAGKGPHDHVGKSVEDAQREHAWLGDYIAKAGRKISGARLARLQTMHTDLGRILSEVETTPDPGGKEGDMPEEITLDKAVLSGLPENVQAYLAQTEKARTDAETARDDAVKKAADLEAAGKPDPSGNPELDEIGKAMADPGTPESVRTILKAQADRITKAEERAAAAEKVAKAEEEARLDAEATATFEPIGKALGLPVPDVAKALRRFAIDHASEADQITTTLKGIVSKADLAEVLKTVGRDTGDTPPEGAWAAIEKAAVEIRKGDPTLTIEVARDRAIQADPALKAQYEKEMGFAR